MPSYPGLDNALSNHLTPKLLFLKNISVTGVVYANEYSAKNSHTCQVISRISEFATDVHNSFESVSAKVYKELVKEEVNCLIENLEDFQIKAYNKPIKVGFQRVYDKYKTLEDNIYYAAKAFNDFLKLRNHENERIFIKEAERVSPCFNKQQRKRSFN